MSRSIERHRANRHKHALERLAERHFPDATMGEILYLRDQARDARHRSTMAFSDGYAATVTLRGKQLRVVYIPRHDAITTVLP